MAEESPPAPATEKGDPIGLVVIVGLLVLLGVRGSWAMVAIVLALVVVIFLHELGHYLTAKAAGMKVTEFFLGFGPRLWSFRRGETEYGLKAIPAGAYVKIVGMSNLDEVDAADEDRTYRAKPYWRRLSVAVAGSVMHFLLAIVLVYTVFVGFGVPDFESDRFTVVPQPGSPAADAGLEEGDRIVGVDGRSGLDFDALSAYLRSRPGDEVRLRVERGDRVLGLTATLADRHPQSGDRVGYLGVAPVPDRVRSGVLEGVGDAVSETRSAMWQSVAGIGRLFSPDGLSGYYDSIRDAGEDRPSGSGAEPVDPDRPSSIVGIVQVGGEVAREGVVNVLYLLFVVNVFIGVFNLTPLLPFDGGHVVIATYEKIRSLLSGRAYRADVAKLMPLTYVVVAVLVVLFATSLYVDIVDPVRIR